MKNSQAVKLRRLVKLNKVVLSPKEEQLLRTDYTRVLNVYHRMLLGKLLTTLDAVVENDRQLEGLKSRVKDFQSNLWDEIYRQIEKTINYHFEFVKKGEGIPDIPKKRTDDEIVKTVYSIGDIITGEFSIFEKRIVNLMGSVFVDSRLKCISEEVSRIVNEIEYKTWENMLADIYRDFEISKKSSSRVTE